MLRARHARDFRRAFHEAIAGLSERDRGLLRLGFEPTTFSLVTMGSGSFCSDVTRQHDNLRVAQCCMASRAVASQVEPTVEPDPATL